MGAHSDADDTKLGDPILLTDLACPDLVGDAVDEIANLFEFVTVHRKGDVGRASGGDILNNDVDHDMGIG